MEASDGIRIGKLHSKERAGEVARDCDAERAIRAPVGRATRGMLARRHKLPFQRFLAADGGVGLAALARGTGRPTSDLTHEADAAIPLEMYLPVPAHRRAWTGGANVLVATAIGDHDVPVAFDVHGNRRLLDPEHPPATPVIAVVPVETDFSPKPSALIACVEYCGGGGRGRARAPAR